MRASTEDAASQQPIPAPASSRPELGTTRHVHDYAVRTRAACDYPGIISSIESAVRLVYDREKALVMDRIVSPTQTNLIELEKHLLDLSAICQATQGVFYILGIGNGERQFVRFFESGSFVGFYHQNRDNGNTFPTFLTGPGYRVYTEQDIQQRSLRKTKLAANRGQGKGTSKTRNQVGQAYSRKLSLIKKQIEVMKSIATKVQDVQQLRMFVNIIRTNADAEKPDHCYVHTIGISPQEQASIENELQKFRIEGSRSYPTLDSLRNASQPLSLQNEMDVLCSLSNDPFQLYPTVNGPLSQESTRVGYMRYLSFQTPLEEDNDRPLMLPASFRSRYVYLHNNNRPDQCRKLLRYIFTEEDRGLEENRTENNHPLCDIQQPAPEDFPTLPPRTRKMTQRVVKVTAEILEAQRVPLAPSMRLLQVRPYGNFRNKLVEMGTVLWRLSTQCEDYFLMSDYTDCGELLANSFAEVTHLHSDEHTTCTCETYRVISGIAASNRPGEDVLPVGVLCMHCRFFTEEILPRLDSLNAETITPTGDQFSTLELKLQQSRKFLNHPVVLLTNGPGAAKYSVRSRRDKASECAIVTVSSTGIMASCSKGLCQAAQRHKRSVNGLLKLEEASSLCEHLATMHANQEIWAPDHPPEADEEEDPLDGNPQDGINIPSDHQPMTQSATFFNTDNGKWDFGGYSVHKPVEEHDLNKTRNIQARMAVNDTNPDYPRDRQTGCFSGMDLIPNIPDNNRCDCGSSFKNEQYPDGLPPVEDFTCTLYMRHAPVRCKVFYRTCLDERCFQNLKYCGLQDSVFMWSRVIAAGDEIGWDFINRVLSTKVSFSAFCADMTRIYKSINVLSAPFMSKSTFISWFFAWCSRMDINFRAEIDPWCGHNPKYVAGDGTHIGISFRRLSISPLEAADSDAIKTPEHRRFDRVFLHYREGVSDARVREARQHLKNTAKAYLSRGTLDAATRDANIQNILEVCPQEDGCKDFLKMFLQNDMSAELKQASAELFLLLASDAAVTTVLPPRCHAQVLAAANALLGQGMQINNSFRSFCPELGRVMEESIRTNSQHCFANFLLYLLDFVKDMHGHDDSPHNRVPRSYNPEAGVAYYFTEHGDVLRQLPKYQINSRANHDDDPCEDERCTKKYGRVSLGGWTYLFLWFCPLHGHCYGFHIVKGSEGRKDPFSSLYRYMEEPPLEVFYDFACSLSEYCLNREPSFFANTRMWHDVFHGVSHLCGKNFKSQRISFAGVNTEICEQFNSFIQCIKYTATHLSQSHFTFFIQFMIYVWNKKKTATFMRKVDLALAGHE